MGSFTVIPGPSSRDLAEGIAKGLRCELLPVELKIFPDGESKVRFLGVPSSNQTIIVQSTYPPVDTHLMQLLFMCQGMRRMGKKTCIVTPYFGYSRQDKEFLGGEVVSLKAVADLLATFSPKLLITFDFHNPVAVSNFEFPIRNISAVPAVAHYFKENFEFTGPICVSPDLKASSMAKELAEFLGAEWLSFRKSRDRTHGEVKVEEQQSFLAKGRDVIIIDDMISTGGSVSLVAKLAKQSGAKRVIAACTHPLLVHGAAEKLSSSGVDTIIGTNSIPGPFSKVDLSPLVVENIEHHGFS